MKSSRYLPQYIASTIGGFGLTCEAHVRQTSRTRSGKGAEMMRDGSYGGRSASEVGAVATEDGAVVMSRRRPLAYATPPRSRRNCGKPKFA
jgi:hypothetical protein